MPGLAQGPRVCPISSMRTPISLRGQAEADLPRPSLELSRLGSADAVNGDYTTSGVGDTPVVVVRNAEGRINALVNRAHKGPMIC